MKAAPTVSAAQISRAMTAFEKAGQTVKGARLYPDGSITLLTDLAPEQLPTPTTESWVDFTGEPEASRA